MSKLNIYIMLSLLMPAFGVLAQSPDSPTDYRRDKDWDWYTDSAQIVKLYWHSLDKDASVERMRLPWNEGYGIGPIFNIGHTRLALDIHPSDGWVLLLRDFGAIDQPCLIPYMLFYNKYHGILRYIYFGVYPKVGGCAVATLELKHDYSPVLELSGLEKAGFINDDTETDHVERITVMGCCSPGGWNVLDFDLSGYDPDIASKTVAVKISVETYNWFIYKQKGIQEYLDNSFFYDVWSYNLPVLFGANIGCDIGRKFGVIRNAAVRFRDLEMTKKYVNEWAKKDSIAGKWYAAPILKTSAATDNAEWISAMSPYCAQVPFLKGGGSGSQDCMPRTICMMPDEFKLSALERNGALPSLYFYLPGCKVPDPEEAARMNELPLYNKPLGIFSMEAKPQADYGYQLKELWKIDDSNLYETYYDSYLKLSAPLSFELNPYVFDQNKSTVEMSFVSEHQDISEFKSASIPEAYGEYTDHLRYVNSRSDISPNPYQLEESIACKVFGPVKLAVLAKLVPLGKDDAYIPVQMVKAYDLGAREYVGMIEQPFGDIDKGAKTVRLISLDKNYPNPFNPVTTIPFTLETSGKVKIVVHNVRGQEVETLTNRQYNAGQHHLRFDGGDLPSGLYFVRAEITGIGDASVSQIVTRKMTLVR